MKVRYESEDAKVTGYGDLGKDLVEAYEANPWAAWDFPWKRDGCLALIIGPNGRSVPGEQFQAAAIAFSKMVPVIQKMVNHADAKWPPRWRETEYPLDGMVVHLESILQETLDAGRQ